MAATTRREWDDGDAPEVRIPMRVAGPQYHADSIDAGDLREHLIATRRLTPRAAVEARQRELRKWEQQIFFRCDGTPWPVLRVR